jgi:hypothetical protein
MLIGGGLIAARRRPPLALNFPDARPARDWAAVDAVPDGSGNVLAIVDRVTRSDTLAWATEAQRPAIVAGGGGWNNQQIIQHSGANEALISSDDSFALAQPFTTLFVLESTLNNAVNRFFWRGSRTSNSGTALATIRVAPDDIIKPYAGGTLMVTSIGLGTVNILEVLFDDTNSEAWVDGVSDVTGSPGTPGILNGVCFGAGPDLNNDWGGNWARAVFIPGALTAADRAYYTAKLSSYYGVPA